MAWLTASQGHSKSKFVTMNDVPARLKKMDDSFKAAWVTDRNLEIMKKDA